MCAALDLVHDAFTLVRAENRESAARQSVDRLAEARHYYLAIATSTLNASGPAVDGAPACAFHARTGSTVNPRETAW